MYDVISAYVCWWCAYVCVLVMFTCAYVCVCALACVLAYLCQRSYNVKYNVICMIVLRFECSITPLQEIIYHVESSL